MNLMHFSNMVLDTHQTIEKTKFVRTGHGFYTMICSEKRYQLDGKLMLDKTYKFPMIGYVQDI